MKKLLVYCMVGLMVISVPTLPTQAYVENIQATTQETELGQAPLLQEEVPIEILEEANKELTQDESQGFFDSSYRLAGYFGSEGDTAFVPNDGKVKVLVMGKLWYARNYLPDLCSTLSRAEASGVEAYVIDLIGCEPTEEEKQAARDYQAPQNVHFTYTYYSTSDADKLYMQCYRNLVGNGNSYSTPLVAYVDGEGNVYSWQDGRSLTDVASELKKGGVNIDFQMMTVSTPSQAEIIQYVRNTGAVLDPATIYDVNPVTSAPYNPGQLSSYTQSQFLGMINQIRYIAGLYSNVTLDDSYNQMAQAAALVNYANGQLSHYPSQPSGMSDELYQLGYDGASRSNIAYASWNRAINQITLFGWMSDSSTSNRDRLGHRRWILNPAMGKTGIGVVTGGNTYSAMYALDRSNVSGAERGIAWPAQNMPVEYFSSEIPWSLSTGFSEDIASVSVLLTKESTGQTWRFSQSFADGYFNVNNGGYGVTGCIIFQPSGLSFAKGDTFKVQITGLTKGNLEYRVNFFSLSDPLPEPIPVFGWYNENGKSYWYENSVRQGTYSDPKGVLGDGTVRGREIYDPASDAWYWLDACYGGAKAIGKEVWMPYVFQGENGWNSSEIEEAISRCGTLTDNVRTAITSHRGKWIRYDADGKLITGWFTVTASNHYLYPGQLGNTYYYEPITGLMVTGWANINGRDCYFDPQTGVYDPNRMR